MSVVARRYARALFSLSQDNGTLDLVRKEAQEVLGWIECSAEFKSLLKDPFLPLTALQAALKALAYRAALSHHMVSFLLVMAEKGRLSLLEPTLTFLVTLLDEAENLLHGEVTTIGPLSKAYTADLIQVLSKKLGKKIHLTGTLDPTILGGIVLKVGPYLIDASLETRLGRLEARLKG